MKRRSFLRFAGLGAIAVSSGAAVTIADQNPNTLHLALEDDENPSETIRVATDAYYGNVATVAEAQAGCEQAYFLTPARVKQLIAS